MKIVSADIALSSAHAAYSRREVEERMRAWLGPRPPDELPQTTRSPSAVVALSEQALALGQDAAAAPSDEEGVVRMIEDAAQAVHDSPQLRLIRALVEALTGRPVATLDIADLRSIEPARISLPRAQAPQWGVEFERRVTIDERESTAFSASGIVHTADGKAIRFGVSLAMARSYHEITTTTIQAGNARSKDPLVLTFDGRAAELSAQRFAFDLNGDGSDEALPLIAGGSGFLALDVDGDGRITHGGELFGPATGDGFEELTQLDADGSGWIDAGDSAYGELRVWLPDAEGSGTLTSLADRGVGAIFLGRVATPFALRTAANDALGSVRTTGIWLGEDATAGAVQQIDLVV